jgi:hypothetical protein
MTLGIHEHFEQYTESRYGLLTDNPRPLGPVGNGLMFTCEAAIVLKERGMLTDHDERTWWRAVGFCRRDEGWFTRAPVGNEPHYSDPERWDDYVAIAAASAVLGKPAFAVEIYWFGLRSFYRPFPRFPWIKFAGYWPQEPGYRSDDIQCWFWRSPSMRAHFEMCAGRRPWFWNRAVWAIGVAFTGWREPRGQDPWRLTELMVKAIPSVERLGCFPYPLLRLAARIRKRRLLKHWPAKDGVAAGMPAVRAAYFQDANHPLVVWGSS